MCHCGRVWLLVTNQRASVATHATFSYKATVDCMATKGKEQSYSRLADEQKTLTMFRFSSKSVGFCPALN